MNTISPHRRLNPHVVVWYPIILLTMFLAGGGCAQLDRAQLREILKIHPNEWTLEDCNSLLASLVVHNMFDVNSRVRVYATPCYPVFITAYNRKEQLQQQWTDEDFRREVERQGREFLGMTVNWQTWEFLDVKQGVYRDRTQLDSLVVLITIVNKSYPYYSPDLTTLKDRVLLRDDAGHTLRPLSMKGRKGDLLVREETVSVVFPVRRGARHFLDGSATVWLVLEGFGDDVTLPLPVSAGVSP